MKLLFTHRYYYPDTAPYALMLRSIAKHFAQNGHDVHVFASRLSYRDVENTPDTDDGDEVSVRRCWVFRENRRNILTRVLNVVLYCSGLFFAIIRQRPDIVTASTFPPVIAAWTASLAARIVGAKFVYHMQDVHPEVSKFSGGRLGKGAFFRLLRWLDNQTLRRSSAVVVLSEDMADTLRARNAGNFPISVINNFLLDSFGATTSAPVELKKADGKFQVIFAGNLGRFQNLSLLAEGVSRCFNNHPELELFFLGDGAALPELMENWGDHPQVRFASFLPFSQASELIAGADVGLVSLTPDIYRVSYPSKMMTYLGLGTPVLALVEPESALAQEIEENGLGVVPAHPTPEAIEAALEKILSHSDHSSALADWNTKIASIDVVMRRWDKLVDAL